jgi:hypothetical protein
MSEPQRTTITVWPFYINDIFNRPAQRVPPPLLLPPLLPFPPKPNKALAPKVFVKNVELCSGSKPTKANDPPLDIVEPELVLSKLLTLSKSKVREPCPEEAPPPVPPAPSKNPLFKLVVTDLVGPVLMPSNVNVGKIGPEPLFWEKKDDKSCESFLAPLRPGDVVSAEDCNDSISTTTENDVLDQKYRLQKDLLLSAILEYALVNNPLSQGVTQHGQLKTL